MGGLERKKIIFIALALSLAAVIAACVIIPVSLFMRRGPAGTGEHDATGNPAATGGETIGGDAENPPAGLTVCAGSGKTLFSTLDDTVFDPVFDAGGERELTVECTLPGVAVSLLFDRMDGSGGTVRVEPVFEDGKYTVELGGLDFGSGEYTCSLLLSGGDGELMYASSASAVAFGADTVIMICDITASGDFTVTEPFEWVTDGFTFETEGDLIFASGETGEMKIINDGADSIRCGRILCDAPEWNFTVSVPFGAFLEERPFYVYAASVNGKSIDYGEVYVDSQNDWAELLSSDGVLGIKPYVEKLVCEGDFKIGGGVVTRPIGISFSGNIDSDGEILILTDEESEIAVGCAENEPIYGKLRIDAPLCGVIWEGGPELGYVERYMNVRSYNGEPTDPLMGGDGKTEVVSGRVKVGKNYREFVPDGNVIDLELGYADNIDPDNAKIIVALSGDGKSEVLRTDGGCYCVITDGEGKTRGYKVNFYSSEYKLPIVNITTDGGAAITSQDEYIGGTFSIDYNGAYDYDDISGARMGIRGRGNSSWKLEKKPYKIKFESGVKLFGLKKAKKWTLIANHTDRSLIRNKLAYSIGSVLDGLVFVPGAYMVDVFVNGEYMGVYQISEQVEVNEGRVPGEENSTEIDTDYFLEIGGEVTKTSFGYANFSHKLLKYILIKNPEEDVLTKEQFDFISDYVKSVEDAIVDGGDYESLLDVDSLIDWFLLYEFSYNIDGMFRRSDFLLKEKGGKLYFCTPWDFDYAFGNFVLDSAKFSEWICLGTPKTDASDNYIEENIMKYLLKDENFISRLKARWAEVGALMLKTGLETVDEAEEVLTPSALENFRRWKILGLKVQFENKETVKIKTYAGHLEYLRNYMKNRFEWMDKEIGEM